MKAIYTRPISCGCRLGDAHRLSIKEQIIGANVYTDIMAVIMAAIIDDAGEK